MEYPTDEAEIVPKSAFSEKARTYRISETPRKMFRKHIKQRLLNQIKLARIQHIL